MHVYPKENRKAILKRRVPFSMAVVFLIAISIGLIFIVQNISSKIPSDISAIVIPKIHKTQKVSVIERKFKPGPISMEILKTKGCVADGILSGYAGNTGSMVKLINRSECVYLHRSLETWAATPDFEKAAKIMDSVEKSRMVYGMFIAEALRKNADYFYADGNRDFDFSKMCRDGTDNRWGEHTCIPDFEKKEYRRYIDYITRQAMDAGVQSFLFGQIYLQDTASSFNTSEAPEIIAKMRQYAQEKGLQIVIGAQTNSITDEKYLKLFDYIEGGVGIDNAGNIEKGPCWSGKSSCWALLWNERYSSKANNVFLHLDWSGLLHDDMSKFARMNQKTRANTLEYLYQTFTSRGMGFMMPFLATINKNNGGCHGPMKRFYSPDNKYACKDENQINEILRGS